MGCAKSVRLTISGGLKLEPNLFHPRLFPLLLSDKLRTHKPSTKKSHYYMSNHSNRYVTLYLECAFLFRSQVT